jgi:predicted TIM-barrel fold metal-dependent hydrolase
MGRELNKSTNLSKVRRFVQSTVAVVAAILAWTSPLRAQSAPAVDHHQHLFSPATVAISQGLTAVTADDLVRLLDLAGIRRAAVFSVAYQFGNPNRPTVADEYAKVRAENDWTNVEVGRFPDRLVGFCGVNPLKEYALAEISRCAKDVHLHSGLKLHFGNSDVDLANPEHVSKLRDVFRAANSNRMAIVVHMRSSVTKQRPYGAAQARTFIEELLPVAPDVPVQIAHLAGAGGYDDPSVDAALAVFVEALARKDPRVSRVLFDVSGVTGLGNWEDKTTLVAQRIRELGVSRVLYGSDGAAGENLRPREAWAAFRRLPLSGEEFKQIEANVAPYMR